MSKAREEAQWRSGKSEIIGKYRQDHEKLFSVVASRGFTKLPGFAADTETRLELAAKLNLSELNLKIITETVEREIKQAGLDYDISYRAAAVAWEIDKHNLMAAWQQEYGTIQTNMANDEEVLDRLMIEVRGRGSYLIEQKTAIELQAEALKQELAGLDGSTATYEVTLANAKLATARKKLDLIPILLQVVSKEEELIESEKDKADEYEQLLAAEQEVADKKRSELVPAMGALLNASERYAGELPGQIALEKQISAEKVSQAGIATESAVLRTEIAQIGTDISEEDLEQAELKRDLQEERNKTEKAIGMDVLENVIELTEKESSVNADILADEAATNAYLLSKKRMTDSERNRGELVSSNTITAAETSKMDNIAASDASRISRKAVIDAAKEVSAELKHII